MEKLGNTKTFFFVKTLIDLMEHNWAQQSLRASNLLSRSVNKLTALSQYWY